MRTFLRQDPDVIMVGEIRDKATANMAIRASLTGHLVLSTIHTNSAWGIISRLIDMDIPAYLIAGTLNTAVAQRLVRKLCPHCKTEVQLKPENFPSQYKLKTKIEKAYEPVGCAKCHFTGYSGREAIYEVIDIDAELSEAIRSGDHKPEDLLHEKGIVSLSDNAIRLLKEGKTSLDEIFPYLITS